MRVFRIFNSSVTDQPTNQPTNQRTDKASYRVACPQLKNDHDQLNLKVKGKEVTNERNKYEEPKELV